MFSLAWVDSTLPSFLPSKAVTLEVQQNLKFFTAQNRLAGRRFPIAVYRFRNNLSIRGPPLKKDQADLAFLC